MSSLSAAVQTIEVERPLVGGRVAHPSIPLEEVIRLAAAVELLPTEDDQPVDNIISERLMHLLTEILNISWKPLTANGQPRTFLALANVGLYFAVKKNPIVPDVMVSMDVDMPSGFKAKSDLTYFVWDHGKLPEIAIEVVSQKSASEDTEKLHKYEQIGVEYYAVIDPMKVLSEEVLRTYELRNGTYQPCVDDFFPKIGLGLKQWAGEYGKIYLDNWVRWCNADGVLLPMATESIALAAERADLLADRAQQQAERADLETERADRETKRAEALAAKLRELGVDPEAI